MIEPTGWSKPLSSPSDDAKYLDILEDLERRGIPVCGTGWSASAGLNLDDLIHQVEQARKLKKG